MPVIPEFGKWRQTRSGVQGYLQFINEFKTNLDYVIDYALKKKNPSKGIQLKSFSNKYQVLGHVGLYKTVF